MTFGTILYISVSNNSNVLKLSMGWVLGKVLHSLSH